MKILIDTNVLISAALRDRTPEKVILFIVEQPDLEWVVSQEILTEYFDVLARPKFGFSVELLDRWYQLIDSVTVSYPAQQSIIFPRDQKDAIFLNCALSVEADFFVTGDRDFNDAQKLVNTIILSVSQFVRLVMGIEY